MISLRTFVLTAMLLGAWQHVSGQTFLKVIGEAGRAEVGHVAIRASDGGLYVAGSVNDSAMVMRLDGDGNVLWSRRFRPAGVLPKLVMHMMEAPDGTIIGCGSGLDPGGSLGEGFHFRLDGAGNFQWIRSWTDPAIYSRRIVFNTEFEYEMFGGVTDAVSPTQDDLFNAQIDAFNGDAVLITDRIDVFDLQPYIDDMRGIATISGFHYAASAFSVNGPALSGRRIALTTFDQSGYHQDTKYLIYPDNVDRLIEPSDIVAKDDSLTIAYYGDINGSSTNWSVGLIRCDISGTIAWARDFNLGGSGQEQSTRVLATSFGYLIAGRTTATVPTRLFLLAVSNTGDLLWARSYGPPAQAQSLAEDHGFNVADLGDGFLLTGYVDTGGGERDLLLIRTDINGEIVCDEFQVRNAITTVLPDLSFPTTVVPTFIWVPQDLDQPVVEDGGIIDICDVEVDLGPDTGSCGVDILLDAGIPNATYEWQDGSTLQTLEATASGTYWVRVTVGCCVGSDTVEVDIGVQTPVDLGSDTTVCEGSGFSLSAPAGPWDFLWSDGSTGQELLITDPGTYWVELNDGGCTSSDTVVIQVIDLPTVDLGPDVSSCDGSPVGLAPLVEDADTYLWSDGSTGVELSVTTSGTYWLEGTNQCGSVRDTVEVTVVDAGEFDLGPDTVLCTGTSVILAADLPGWSLTWSDGTTDDEVTITGGGVYWLDATNAGCVISDTIAVDELDVPVVDLGQDTVVCEGGTLLLAPVLIDVQDVSWSDGSTGDSLLVTSTGAYTITVENACGSASDEVVVTIVAPLGIDLGPDTVLCGSETLGLELDVPGAELVWQDGTQGPNYLVDTAGTYWVDAELDGCTASDTLVVGYSQLAELDLGPDTVLCTVPTYLLDAGNDDAQWQDGSTGATYEATRTGWYVASITNYCGTVVDSARVSFAVPVVEMEDVALCAGTKVELDPQGELVEILWTTGDTSLTIVVGEGAYGYEAVDIYGCLHADHVEVRISPGSDGSVYIPNSFTPNMDGFNDRFLVYGPEDGDLEMVIHDRWGQEVYRTIDPFKGWDGTAGGQDAPPDVYIYTVTYPDRCNANNTLVERRGHLTLLR